MRRGAGVRALIVAQKPGNAGGAKGGRKVETDQAGRRTEIPGLVLLLLHAAGEAEAPARSYAELSFQGDLDADGLRHGGRGEPGWTLVLYTGYDNEACPLSCAGPSVPSWVRPPTGEPDAGDLQVRFGGRGRRQPLPTPINEYEHERHGVAWFRRHWRMS